MKTQGKVDEEQPSLKNKRDKRDKMLLWKISYTQPNSRIYSSGHQTREKGKGLDKVEKVKSLGGKKKKKNCYRETSFDVFPFL